MGTNYGSQGPQDPPWQGNPSQIPPWMQPQPQSYQPPPQSPVPQQGGWQQYQQQQPPQYQQQQWQGFPQMPQYPPPQQPQKRRGRLPIIIGIVVIVLLFACVGAGALASRGANTSTAGSTVVGNVNGSTPTTVPTQASSYKVGQVVNVSDAWSVTVLSAKASSGSAIYTPKAGMRYLVLDLAMKNLTTANHTISSIIQFTLRGNDGTKYDIAIYPDGGSQIDGNVDGGQPAKGVIVFEVPTTVNAFHLVFEANPFDPTAGRATWDLSV